MTKAKLELDTIAAPVVHTKSPKTHARVPSLTLAEKVVLHALFVDSRESDSVEDPSSSNIKQEQKTFNDDVLFSIPGELCEPSTENLQNDKNFLPSLWKAHEEGVKPEALVMRSSLHRIASVVQLLESECIDDDNDEDLPSDVEVRHEEDGHSSDSSWDEDDIRHDYSAWEVLKDEYAKDFGFDYNRTQTIAEILNENAPSQNVFQILGTSVEDISAQPHVLSPPLMDALMKNLPNTLVGENYWLKFSMLRDGACLDTLKAYCRASPHTILAIETDEGDVFGCYTSDPWTNHFGFYGSKPSFVWKLKESRKTVFYSLFDQAASESQIDVYDFKGRSNQLVQICRHDTLAVGGDEDATSFEDVGDFHAAARAMQRMGFAISLEEDLIVGTTSPSAIFGSPSLCGTGERSESFQVSNIEVWTFTPCFSVKSAEKLELSRYVIENSGRMESQRSSNSHDSVLSSQSFSQESFYRRVGQDPEGDERRQRWQYLNMMSGAGPKGLGSTPKFM